MAMTEVAALDRSRELALLDAPAPAWRSSDRPRLLAGGWRATVLQAMVALLVSGGVVWLRAYIEERVTTVPPGVQHIDIYGLIVDSTPVRVTITAGWEKVPEWTTFEAVGGDPTLWRRMHLDDWDGVPAGLRERALESMLGRYRHVLTSPSTWDRMGAHDWDGVPQPIRALAFRHMTEYWTGYYDVGGAYAIPRGLMADTIAAIVMTESWFEHRAENRNPWGNRDLGVAQASDGARARMADWYADGRVDFRLAESDYFNPWLGTRFTAFWMGSLLDQLDGDLETAVRAYHRGTRRALAGRGVPYARMVADRRQRFIRNGAGSGAWDYLWRRDREIRAQDWPWLALARRSVPIHISDGSGLAITLGTGLAR
jgi:hypothetical protein